MPTMLKKVPEKAAAVAYEAIMVDYITVVVTSATEVRMAVAGS